jgi:hypothetical protein
MSWRIFIHSVRQVFGNLEGALRVSAVLTVLQIVVTLTVGRALLLDQVELQRQMQQGNLNWPMYFMVLLLLVLAGMWIAVGWHRYVLTNEVPGIVPRLHLDRVMGYFGKTILIGLLLLPVALFFGFLVGFAIAPIFREQIQAQPLLFGGAIGLLIYLPVGIIAMRLSAALPGVALEPGVSVFSGWRATEGQTGTILGLVLLSIIAALVLGLPNIFFFAPGSLPSMIWHFISQWVLVMVGVSILTTLYGHYVEGRPLV